MTNNNDNEEEVIKAMIQGSVDEGFAVASNYSKDTFETFITKYWKPGFSIIRPSGNPMSREVWEGMISSDDVEMVSSELLKVNNVQILACGSAAFAVYTTHDQFKYKGTPNDDIATFTVVLEKNPSTGSWLYVHAHRGTGQKPS